MRLGKITLAAVGKLKKEHWHAAQTDYAKRMRQYTNFNLIEVRDYIGRSIPNEVAVVKEGDALLEATRTANFRIALTVNGNQFDSITFADTLLHWTENFGDLAFLIGGPLGLSTSVLQAVHYELSLSLFTYPHELARIVLLEQLYRAATIIHNHPYHK